MKTEVKVICEKGCVTFIEKVRGFYVGSGYHFCVQCESPVKKRGF